MFFTGAVSGRETERGLPFIRNYGPREYHAGFDNWTIVRDRQGLMYFGNGTGVLQFDGVSWRHIDIPGGRAVRCLDTDETGVIYVAAVSDFGYLTPDSEGLPMFVSLQGAPGTDAREDGDVWSVRTSAHGVYFKTGDRILRWRDGKIKIWNSVDSYRVYNVNDTIYVRNRGQGLMKIRGDALVLAPGGEKFSNIGIYNMLPFPAPDGSEKILITTNTDGLFLYDGKDFVPFKTAADAYLKENQVYNAAMLPDSSFAFATQRGGAVVINRSGRLLQIVNEAMGLQSQVVYDVYPNRQGGFWLAMNDGIAWVESPSPFSLFDKALGLRTAVSSAVRFGGRLYITDAFGLNRLEKSARPGEPARFVPLPAVTKPGLHLLPADGKLFTASNGGVFRLDGPGKIEKLTAWPSNFLQHSRLFPDRIYVGTMDGLFLLQKRNGSWRPAGRVTDITDNISQVVETGTGDLWLRCRDLGVIRLEKKPGGESAAANNGFIPKRYDTGKSMPFRVEYIFQENGRVLFATDDGLKHFDAGRDSFMPDFTFGSTFADSGRIILSAVQDSRQQWIVLTDSAGRRHIGTAVRQENGGYRWRADSRLNRLDPEHIFAVFPDRISDSARDTWWISTAEGLVRYDSGIRLQKIPPYPPLIRQVTVNGDSILYFGIRTVPAENSGNPFTFPGRNILFKFAAPYYDLPAPAQFRFYLEGNDGGWSDWTTSPRKEYTNLAGGTYRFRLQSRNVYGDRSRETSFEFSVFPAWYRTWPAYLIFGGLLLLLLYLIRGYELKRFRRKQQRELEQIEYRKLMELDQIKTRFFTNISHEFRTPLTLILGQVDSLMGSDIGEKAKSQLQVAHRNSQRLLDLINQLLDLAKLESGTLKLKAEHRDVVSFVKSLFFSFESLAKQKNITLSFHCGKPAIPVLFEPDKMEKVFYNLFSNALKFTPAGGRVQVKIYQESTAENNQFSAAPASPFHASPVSGKAGYVRIKIRDTGTGIPADQLPHIFDRFYQVDSSQTREHEGTGIGLALTKELVELHNGRISVTSEEGAGTEFTVFFPISNSPAEKNAGTDIPGPIPETGVRVSEEREIIDTHLPAAGGRTPANGNHEIILAVEDNADVRSYICEELEHEYRLIEAANGTEGVRQAQKYIPDLIVTDVMMPEMDGYEFCRRIRADERTSHIPVIMLTARAALDDKIEGLETGADAYLTKPFSSKELRARIKNLILQRKQLTKRFSKATTIKPSEISAHSMDRVFLEKTIQIIESHFADEQFSGQKLAGYLNMSQSQLNRKLSALIDQPAGKLIRSMRLQRAADLLKQNAGTVGEICYMVGFSDQANFSRAFKKQFGVTPGEFRKK